MKAMSGLLFLTSLPLIVRFRPVSSRRMAKSNRAEQKGKRVQRRWSFHSRSGWALVSAPVLVTAGLAVATAGPAQAHSAPAGTRVLTPNKTNNLDCNG